MLLLHRERAKELEYGGENWERGEDMLPTAFRLMEALGALLGYWVVHFFGGAAVVLISCFLSDARRHALCMATKSLTLLLLITEKLRVTGPDCAAVMSVGL